MLVIDTFRLYKQSAFAISQHFPISSQSLFFLFFGFQNYWLQVHSKMPFTFIPSPLFIAVFFSAAFPPFSDRLSLSSDPPLPYIAHSHTLFLLVIWSLSFFFPHFLGSGSEGVDDLCFHTYGEFSPPTSPSPSYPPPSPKPRGPYLSLEAHIPALRPKS